MLHKTLVIGVGAWATLLAAASVCFGEGQQVLATRVVLVSVTDADGRPYVNLGPDDFVIEEKGEAREVLSVYVADYPVIVMLDNGSHASADLAALRDAASDFVKRIGERPVVLATLTNPPEVLGSFSEGRPAVLRRIEELMLSPTVVLRPIEAVAEATSVIGRTGSPFGAIVVVSTREMDAIQPDSAGLLTTIFSSGVIVHAVRRRVPSTAPSGRGLRPRLDGDLVRELADQTGGEFTTVFSTASYSVALEQVATRLASEMMVQYLVPENSDAGREVRVGVTVPGARVRGLGVSK